MRFNDKELANIGEQKGVLEGILQYMKPQGNNWSDWYQQPCFKERYFKLIANLLYYYRLSDRELLGVLVMENAHVAFEQPHKGISFAFSVIFKINDKLGDDDAKHIFSCRCDDEVNKWVSALKRASFEYWRIQYLILKVKLDIKKGQDPVLEYPQNKCNNYNMCMQATKRTKKKRATAKFYNGSELVQESVDMTTSTFYSNGVDTSTTTTTKESCTKINKSSGTNSVVTEDLINTTNSSDTNSVVTEDLINTTNSSDTNSVVTEDLINFL